MTALGELLAAIALGVLAWWCWHRGVILSVQEGVQISRIDGAWWAGAVGLATLAGIAVLAALRQLVRGSTRRIGPRADPRSDRG